MKIGIFGGTFNPPHNGHLFATTIVKQELNLDKIIFIPTFIPPHKENPTILATHRYNMTELAIANNPYFEISDIELRRKGKSYTKDTLIQLREKNIYKNADFYLIIGSDMLKDIEKWKDIDDVFKLSKVVVIKRPYFPILAKPYIKKQLLLLEIFALNISSTMIRKLIKENKSIKYLLPESVEEYIYKNNLYK